MCQLLRRRGLSVQLSVVSCKQQQINKVNKTNKKIQQKANFKAKNPQCVLKTDGTNVLEFLPPLEDIFCSIWGFKSRQVRPNILIQGVGFVSWSFQLIKTVALLDDIGSWWRKKVLSVKICSCWKSKVIRIRINKTYRITFFFLWELLEAGNY